MSEFATLKIVDGDFEQGFRVILRTGTDGNITAAEIDGWLPPAPEIPKLFKYWQSSYKPVNFYRALKAPKNQVTNYSIQEAATQLNDGINGWLNSGDTNFRPIRDQLIGHLHNNDQIRLIIQTDNVQLWQLPWHLWKVEDCPIEVHLSASEYKQVKRFFPSKRQAKVRILVILGDSTGINNEADLKLLERELPDAEIVTLRNPKKEALSNSLWEQNFDILFFAGHSSEGKLYLSQDEYLTIEELKYSLNRCIASGLKLAIFNSCDGLELGRELVNLQIPATVVMRELLPDQVAVKFLGYFLRAFAEDGKSLSASIRDTRARLLDLEETYPCASWLPVICHNPSEELPTWKSLLGLSTSIGDKVAEGSSIRVDLPISVINWLLSILIKLKFRMAVLGLVGAMSLLGLRYVASDVFNKMGVARIKASQFSEAKIYLRWAFKLNPNNSSALNNQGKVDEAGEEDELACQKFQDAKKLGNRRAWNNEAVCEIDKGNNERAENLLRKILGQSKSKENEYATNKNLGWALWKQGKYQEAETYLRSAIDLMPNHGSAYCLLAQVLEESSYQADSLVQWNNCFDFASSLIPEERKWLEIARERIEAE